MIIRLAGYALWLGSGAYATLKARAFDRGLWAPVLSLLIVLALIIVLIDWLGYEQERTAPHPHGDHPG